MRSRGHLKLAYDGIGDPMALSASDIGGVGESLSTSGRARSLVVCRESAKYGLGLLQGLIAQTLDATGRDLDSGDLMTGLGATVMADDFVPPDGVNVWRVHYGSTEARLISAGAEFYLYSLGSAAAKNSRGRNDFSMLLIGILNQLRPRVLRVATTSRLVRSMEHAPLVLDAIQQNVDELRAGQLTLHFTGPTKQIDAMVWQLLVTLAASERDLIVQRLFAGKVAAYKRGVWIHGPRSVPLGYRLDTERALVVDPEQKDLLIAVLSVLADTSVSATLAQRRIVDLGLAARRAEMWDAVDAEQRLSNDRSPHLLGKRLLRWADLYRHGSVQVELPCPFPGLSEYQGLPVVTGGRSVPGRRADEPDGSVVLTYEPGRPDIDPALIDQAVAGRRQARTRNGGAAAHHRVAPLNGWSWTEGGRQYRLRGERRDTYDLRARAAGNESAAWTTGSTVDGRRMATISRTALHHSIYSTLTRALSDGLPAVRLDGMDALRVLDDSLISDRNAARAERLRAELGNHQQVAQRLARRLGTEEDDGVASAIRDQLKRTQAAIEVTRRQLDEVETLVPVGDELSDFTSETDFLLLGLSCLVGDAATVTQDKAAALATLFHQPRIVVEGRRAHWSLYLLVPAEGEVVRLGPLSGSVAVAGRAKSPAELRDSGHLPGGGLVRRDLRTRLEERGWPKNLASCAASSPGSLIARVILDQDVPHLDGPDGFDAGAFLEHVRTVWVDGAPWDGRVYLRTHPKRQVLTDLVAALSGQASVAQVRAVAAELGLGETDPYRLTQPMANGSAKLWTPPVRRVGSWSTGTPRTETFMDSRRCPSCGSPATGVTRTLEVPGDLLCRVCLVSPLDPLDRPLVFPYLYRDLALPATTFPRDLLARCRAVV